MLIEAGITYSREVPLIWLPLDRIARELFLLVFQRQHILEDIDRVSRHSLFLRI
jgi:hypothetical protein